MDEDIEVKADPKRPYKLWAAMISAFLTSLIAGNVPQPVWAVAVETGIVAAIAVFLMPNPYTVKRTRSKFVQNEDTLF